jgi:pyruvate dehydrogenase E2 component (dihydrolipoamide acetyltransferase)
MADFVMPVLGADMKAGELITWLKKPGEKVEKGEVIAEVETDKALVEVESMFTGVVQKLLVEPGEKVPVGTLLAIITVEGPEEEAPEAAVAAPPAPGRRGRAVGGPVRAPSAAGRLRVSPVAQQLADQKGVSLASITGTGPGGRIMLHDVEQAIALGVAPAPAPGPEDRARRMRQSIAAAMGRSHREIPHFHIESVIDLGRAIEWLTETNTRRPVAQRLLYVALLLKATALALRKVPELNAVWAEDHVELRDRVHVGVAIAMSGGGLVAPAIHDTDRLSLDELMAQFRDLVRRARAGRLRSSEIADPTITVTSLGELGAERVFGLIYPPQVALVGYGRVIERPLAVEGRVEVRSVINASLAGDHRAVDGYRGSVYLAELERLLQEPEGL